SEIAEADGVIAEAARHLPEKTRALVAGIRRTIPAMLRRLDRRTKGWADRPDLTPQGRTEPGAEEKF
ncbi:hypothetical protein, partial [Loktanella sp. SALINAS62]|uniref:hypothetical protein n=1 Tax=Loktanella sp. SALINAS62 TaxID=2706124 RepID=UPI001B8D5F9E